MIPAELDGLCRAPPIEPATLDAVFDRVAAYYGAKVVRHGATPRGVDWSCAATQWLRFVQLLKLCDFDAPFSLIDVGCGYGALAAFLRARYPDARVDYLGIDLCAAMVRCAKRKHRGRPATRFQAGRSCPTPGGLCVSERYYERYARLSSAAMGGWRWRDAARPAPHGAAGLRSELPDRGAGRLAAGDALLCRPTRWAGFCAELSCDVEVLDGYGMSEFTLLAPV